MKLDFLYTLEAVIKSGSYASAASQVHVTPSAIGLQMRQLENYFGQPLFDRSARQARATPFALDVLHTVQGTLRELQRLKDRQRTNVSGHVSLGTVESTQISMLPVALRELRFSAPALNVQVTRGTSEQLLSELKGGVLDAAILVRPPAGGGSRLHWVPLKREPFVLVVPRDAKEKTPVQLLQAHEWIRLDRSTTGGRIASRYVEKTVPNIKSSLEIPGTEAIVALVAAGLGVSVIPKLRPELRNAWPVREVSLGRSAPARQIAYVCRAADSDAFRLQVVLDAFQKAVAEGKQ